MSSYRDEFNGNAEPATAIVVPSIVEEVQSGNPASGMRVTDVFSSAIGRRQIMVDGPINTQSAAIIAATIMALDAKDPNTPIMMIINSPGGEVLAGLKIFDAMTAARCKIITVGMGQCMSMGSFLLAAGDERLILPNATVMVHQPSSGTRGTVSNQQEQLNVSLNIKERMRAYYHAFLNVTDEEFSKIYERDSYINAHAAVALGHADKVVPRLTQEPLNEREQRLFDLSKEINDRETAKDPILSEAIAKRTARLAAEEAARTPANDTAKPGRQPKPQVG